MRTAALSLAMAMTCGCTTASDDRVEWNCLGTASAPFNQAASVRIVDALGQLRLRSTEWVRKDGSDFLDLRSRWSAQSGPPGLEGATIHLRLHLKTMFDMPGQLSLSTPLGAVGSAWSTGASRELTVTGAQIERLIGKGETIWVSLHNRSGQLMGATGIEPKDFADGIALARLADARSLVASQDFRRLCKRQMRIVRT